MCGLLVCRLNFTLSHLDVTCEAYDHFRTCLRQLEQLRDGQLHFTVEPVEAAFPQRLEYERIRQLVSVLGALWNRQRALFREACEGFSPLLRVTCAGWACR